MKEKVPKVITERSYVSNTEHSKHILFKCKSNDSVQGHTVKYKKQKYFLAKSLCYGTSNISFSGGKINQQYKKAESIKSFVKAGREKKNKALTGMASKR